MAAIAILLAGALSAAGLGAGPATASQADLLPDLDQEAPAGLALARSAGHGSARWVLGFRSAVRNVGRGPLIVHGHRRGHADRWMTADQEIRGAAGAARRVRGVGRMRYVVAPTHRHWHYMDFDRYTLHRVGGGAPTRHDAKTGFCLGDRYVTPGPLAAAPPVAPRYTSRCGLGRPGRLRVTEGMSVGFGDDYPANLEGQYVALAGLPAGRYTLTHRVNADRRLVEDRYDNDAASVLLSLRWRSGVPDVHVLARCEDSATCHAPARRTTAAAEAVQPIDPWVLARTAALHCTLRAPVA
jgi:hypothetical protein